MHDADSRSLVAKGKSRYHQSERMYPDFQPEDEEEDSVVVSVVEWCHFMAIPQCMDIVDAEGTCATKELPRRQRWPDVWWNRGRGRGYYFAPY